MTYQLKMLQMTTLEYIEKFLCLITPKPLLNQFNKSFGLMPSLSVYKRVDNYSFAPALDVSKQYTPKWPY